MKTIIDDRTVIKRSEGYHYMGQVMKRRRKELGLSLNDLHKLIKAGTGEGYIMLNRATRQLSKQTIWRMELMCEFELDTVTALVIKKILES